MHAIWYAYTCILQKKTNCHNQSNNAKINKYNNQHNNTTTSHNMTSSSIIMLIITKYIKNKYKL